MKLQFILLTVLLLPISQTLAQTTSQAVSLQKMQLPSTGQLEGISNLFFTKLEDKQIRYPADWKDVEISPLMQNSAFVPISVIRYRAASGNLNYVVDTNGDLDFGPEPVLQFRRVKDLRIADFELPIQPVASRDAGKGAGKGPRAWKMSYQMVLSDDGYTYARISEYRQGQIRLGDKLYGITLRPRSRNSPQFTLSGDTVCLIDLNNDGDFSPRWRISEKGEVSPAEEIEIGAPFIAAGERLRIVDLDAAGSGLKIQPSTEEVSISRGFKAPAFTLKGVDNNSYSSAELKGKIVLLEFWSVSCPFCKRILPEVNALIKKDAGKDFVALAVAREEDGAEIKSHLQAEPRNATVVLNDKATWKTYNSQGITPTYYLIDSRGVIRLAGYGASTEQLKVIEKLVEQMRKEM